MVNIDLRLGDCLEIMKDIPDKSIQCCVTSPPYYGMRDYQTATWDGGDINCDHNPQRPDGGQRHNRSLPPGRGGMYKSVCAKCGATRTDSQIGLEKTPEEYVAKMVEVFREVRRVLRNDGTCWVNLGDSYAGGKGQSGSIGSEFQEGRNKRGESLNKGYQTLGGPNGASRRQNLHGQT